MSGTPFVDTLKSATFRRAFFHLGLVWLFLTLGAVLLLDRLSKEVGSGWELRSSVVEWVDDAEGEICFRRGVAGLEVLSGGAARSIAAGEPGGGDGFLDADELADVDVADVDVADVATSDPGADPDAADLDLDGLDFGGLDYGGVDDGGADVGGFDQEFDVEEGDSEGFDMEVGGQRAGAGEWFCVTREALMDDAMEALMSSAFELTPPRRFFPPLFILGAVWLVVGAVLVFYGAFRLAAGPTALVRDLERVRHQIDGGDHGSRVRRRGGDFDIAASGINAILDRLDYTISTLSEVSDNIAHDLRTPLTRLQGQLDLVRRSPAPTSAMIDSMQDEATQLLDTFNALLRIAHVKGGSRRKGFRQFDLVAVARDAGELYEPAMEEKLLSFLAILPPHPVEVFGDPELWMQAISNLLDNALKYTPENGRVELEVRPGPKRSSTMGPSSTGPEPSRSGFAAQLRISDSGHGIPDGEIDKVLERFYRLSSHRQQKGSGLGLSLVVAICELHSAPLELVNREGLTVLVELPG